MNDKLGVKRGFVKVRMIDRKNPDIKVERSLRLTGEEFIELEEEHGLNIRAMISACRGDEQLLQEKFGYATLTKIIWMGRVGWFRHKGKGHLVEQQVKLSAVRKLLDSTLYEEYLLALMPVLAAGTGFKFELSQLDDESEEGVAEDPTKEEEKQKVSGKK